MFDKGSGSQALVQMADVHMAMSAHGAADMQVALCSDLYICSHVDYMCIGLPAVAPMSACKMQQLLYYVVYSTQRLLSAEPTKFKFHGPMILGPLSPRVRIQVGTQTPGGKASSPLGIAPFFERSVVGLVGYS